MKYLLFLILCSCCSQSSEPAKTAEVEKNFCVSYGYYRFTICCGVEVIDRSWGTILLKDCEHGIKEIHNATDVRVGKKLNEDMCN